MAHFNAILFQFEASCHHGTAVNLCPTVPFLILARSNINQHVRLLAGALLKGAHLFNAELLNLFKLCWKRRPVPGRLVCTRKQKHAASCCARLLLHVCFRASPHLTLCGCVALWCPAAVLAGLSELAAALPLSIINRSFNYTSGRRWRDAAEPQNSELSPSSPPLLGRTLFSFSAPS